jgi:glycopeptide antibiotics resistance protein
MSIWVLEGGLSVMLFLVLAPILIAPFLGAVYRRYRYPAPGPTLLAAATGLYACALVAFTTFPLPEAPDDFCDGRAMPDYWHLVPGESVRPVIDTLQSSGFVATLTSGAFLQVAFNVLFFVPLGFLVAYRLDRGVGTAALAGLGTSLLIEATQGTGLWGLYPCPYRLADVDDLLANTAGAVVGWGLGALLARWRPFREPPARPDTGAPTIRRRLLATGLDLTILLVVTVIAEFAYLLVGEVRGWEGGTDLALTVIQGAVAVLLLLVLPMVRGDRATPGQATVLLTCTDPAAPRPAARSGVAIRFAVRWLPVLIWGVPAIIVLLAVELTTVAVRGDRRSLAGVLGRTATRTVDGLAADRAAGRGAPVRQAQP